MKMVEEDLRIRKLNHIRLQRIVKEYCDCSKIRKVNNNNTLNQLSNSLQKENNESNNIKKIDFKHKYSSNSEIQKLENKENGHKI